MPGTLAKLITTSAREYGNQKKRDEKGCPDIRNNNTGNSYCGNLQIVFSRAIEQSYHNSERND